MNAKDSIVKLKSAKPYTRWWWFNIELREADISNQLHWLKKNNFGGVEIAFIYPVTGHAKGPAYLSKKWTSKVAFAKRTADRLGLGCDFTFGSLWPFGGSFLRPEDTAQTYKGPSKQLIRISWEHPKHVPVLNHLDRKAFARYARTMGNALRPALKGSPSALFCDSLEVDLDGIWTKGFGTAFRKKFGYDILPFMDNLDRHPRERYDYRELVGRFLLEEFYKPYTAACRRLGAYARVQCHGAMTDLLSAYAVADLPESEAILFDPEFSVIAASAAAHSGLPFVSAEAFTCLYGWLPWPGPGQYQMKEQVADIKLVADALFANGVNLVVWHGMPYNPKGGNQKFYASVHVGPDSGFADELPSFNKYMEKVSSFMRKGRTYSEVAQYIPYEDTRMDNLLPKKLHKPSAMFHWEMQYTKPSEALRGYHPLWVSGKLLADAEFKKGRLHCGRTSFSWLYSEARYMTFEALSKLLEFAKQGLPVVITRKPKEPGRQRTAGYSKLVEHLFAIQNVGAKIEDVIHTEPLVKGDDLPDFWCKVEGDSHYIYFANPKAQHLKFPLSYGQGLSTGTAVRDIKITIKGWSKRFYLAFKPYQSLLLKITPDKAEFIDIGFVPKTPIKTDKER